LPDREVRLTAVVSADGRSYVGTYENGVKVWGVKLSDDDAQPVVRRAASGPVKVGQDKARPTSPSSPKVVLMEMLTTRTWMHNPGGRSPRPIRFLPSGEINQPGSRSTWSLKGSSLTMRWSSSNAPGGVWIDRCTLSRDGRSYAGTNQDGLPVLGRIAED
jgi:hypothetical protein